MGFRTFSARLLLSLIVLAALVLPAVPAAAAGYNPFGKACSGNAPGDTTVCATPAGGDPLTNQNGILHKVTQIIAVIAGVAAVIVIIVAGISYITSGGNAEQVNKAKQAILFALVGLAVIVLAQTIISLVIR
ncbi:MAG TPA: hypothetical protein VF572_05895 [Candidatus Saccharimonadales bacterium]|jgi:hypothetical protein